LNHHFICREPHDKWESVVDILIRELSARRPSASESSTADTNVAGSSPKDTANASDICLYLQKEFSAVKMPSLEALLPKLSDEHFHLMISYRVNTEGEGCEESSNFALHFYNQLKVTSQSGMQDIRYKHIPVGKFPRYAKNPDDLENDVHERILSSRVFLDKKCLVDGDKWSEGFVDAVCNAIVIIPVLTCHSQDDTKTGVKVYSGSIGRMIGFEPLDEKSDKVDNFLLEITIANALMEIPSERRWLQSILPVFVGRTKKSVYQPMDLEYYDLVGKLSSLPSLKTNKEAARLLMKKGYPVSETLFWRSIRQNIELLFEYQGIKMSELGIERCGETYSF
jgi:hypothetical protein